MRPKALGGPFQSGRLRDRALYASELSNASNSV